MNWCQENLRISSDCLCSRVADHIVARTLSHTTFSISCRTLMDYRQKLPSLYLDRLKCGFAMLYAYMVPDQQAWKTTFIFPWKCRYGFLHDCIHSLSFHGHKSCKLRLGFLSISLLSILDLWLYVEFMDLSCEGSSVEVPKQGNGACCICFMAPPIRDGRDCTNIH